MAKVAIIECKNYDEDLVYQKIKQLISGVIDFGDIIKKDMTVVLKVNLVSAIKKEKCATTHPSVVKAVAKLVIEKGAKCIIADSSGGLFNSAYMNNVYKVTEMDKVADETGAILNQDFTFSYARNENAMLHKDLPIISVLQNADLIINLAKLKTHTFMGYSGAVKNMFGAIPGLMKVEMHGNFKDQYTFSNHIIDIFELLKGKICLNIVDGVWGMEGEGPTAGVPVQMNCLLASQNAYELDLCLTKIMNLNYKEMPLLIEAEKRNLLKETDIIISSECLDKFFKKDFVNTKIQIYKKTDKKVPPFLNGFVHKLLTRRPVIKQNKCRGCKKCYNHCPVKAIEMQEGKGGKQFAKINYDKCIRCFCCQELCPFEVVKIKAGILHKFIHKQKNVKK